MKDKAFELIFRDYHRMVTAYLCTLVGNEEEALDLTQEVFLVAYRRMKEVDPGQSIGAWLRATAWNLASNALRKTRRHRLSMLQGPEIERTFAALDGVLMDRRWDERLEALDRCLERLPDAQRRSVDLFYRAGESARAIARKLGVLEATVFQFMWQARRNLRRCIEGLGAREAGTP